jgi:hypothetical protein
MLLFIPAKPIQAAGLESINLLFLISGSSLLLYQFTRKALKLIIEIIVE